MRQNEKKTKKYIKEICQGNYEKKRFIQSFKPTILQCFNNHFVFERSYGRNGCYGEWRFENTMQLLWLLLFMEQLIVTNIKVAKQLT